ncbi:MAG: C25 family cysteine peptidase [candidate division WOR-3 bacterium]
MKRMMCLFVFALSGAIAGWLPFEPGGQEKPAEFKVISSNEEKTVVELNLEGIYVDSIKVDNRLFQTLTLNISAGGVLTQVGSPELPVVSRFIAIPDDKDVSLRVIAEETVTLKGFNIYPAQAPMPEEGEPQPFVIDEKRYSTDEFYPDVSCRTSAPMIMRDFRLVQLILQPVRFNPVSGELQIARRLQVELRYEGQSNINVKFRRSQKISRAFEPLYKSFIANYRFLRPKMSAENGSYLIIVYDSFVSAVEPFARWKQRKGWRTKVVTTSQIGGNDTALIYSYINNAYNNWPYPPEYVLLVGDAPDYVRCNHWPGHSDASDLYYSLHEGNDILADLFIARACVRTRTEAEAVMNKLYKYEMAPYLEDTVWFNKVCAVAGYESGNPGRFWTVVLRIRNYVLGRPFTQFDTLFQRWGLNTAQALTDSLNSGRSWMLYRGHGLDSGWANVSPAWYNSRVYNLNNGRMLPMVIAPTCLSGNFDEPHDCHAETWVKAGEEKGGCGYFGSSEVSYSGYNDSLAAGTFFAYADSLNYTFAQCTQAGKLFMLLAYPLPDQISEEEIYMFNNFGEPELNIWSKTPQGLTVNHPATVLIGSFPFEVAVTDGTNPVLDAQVCVMAKNDTSVYYVGHTNSSGEVEFTIQTTLPGDSLYVTVTGRNLQPYLGSAITIAPNSAYVLYLKSTVNDSAEGNNDHIINPGETIQLPVWVKNWGSLGANSVTGKLRTTDPNITIIDSIRPFGNIPAGDSALTGSGGFKFSVAQNCTNGYILRFNLECRDALDSVWNSNINLWVGTPVLVYAGKTVNDPPPGGNGNGWLDPNESAQLLITVRNTGLGNGYDVSGVLRSGDSRLQVIDSTSTFGFIPKDTTGTNYLDPFTLAADRSIPLETAIPCTLLLTANGGYTWTLPFVITVGEIRAIDPIPDGPRQPALYWAYDDIDSNYIQHPEFNWIEIKDIGTRLVYPQNDSVKVIALPEGFGPLRFYGQEYDSLSISADGWLCPGFYRTPNYTNQPLPNSQTPPGVICVNWDDLYPDYNNTGFVYYYHDTSNHRLIIEYDSVYYYTPRTLRDKFEVIIYDTTISTPSGDNLIILQYLTANGYSSSTVGIQDPSRSIAIQYLYNSNYHRGAAGIVPGRAIKFITGEPLTGIDEGAEFSGITRLELNLNPNPMKERAWIKFSLPNPAQVKLGVFDITGREVRNLLNSKMGTGSYTLAWDGKDNNGRTLAQGIYFIRLKTHGSGEGDALITKAVLIR